MAAAPPQAPSDVRAWWNLAAVAVLLRFLLMPFGGFPTDIGTFKAWAASLAESGPPAFYGAAFADYLPGYLYVLWGVGEIHQVVRFNDPAFLFALKLPAAVADLLTAWIIFAFARRLGCRYALPLSASYMFNPAIIFNSAVWGQADAVGASLALAGVVLLGVARPPVVAALLTAAVLVKPQTAPALVPAGVFLLRTLGQPAEGPPRWDLLLAAAVASLATLVVAVSPFGLTPWGLVGVLRSSVGVYPFSSVVAFNLWGAVHGFWISDEVRWLGVPLYALGGGAAALALCAVAVWTWRHARREPALLAAAVALLATFVLPTRIHERYLLPAIPFFAAAAASDRRALWIYAGLSVIMTGNLLFAYTRPYLETVSLPGWWEATVFSPVGVRGWSAVGALTLPLAFILLLRPHDQRPAGDGPGA